MNKIILGILLGTGCSFLALQSVEQMQLPVKQDAVFQNLYYNETVFKDGLFNESRTSLISAKHIPETLIAWDLNGVVLEKRLSTLKDTFQELFSTEGYAKSINLFYLLGKLFVYKNYLLLNKDPRGHVWDALFTTLETSIPGQEQAKLLRYIIQKSNFLNFQTVTLLQELQQQGFQNVVLSNMGQYMANTQINLLQKQKDALPEDATQHADFDFILNFLQQPTNLIPSTENHWLHKPDRGMYQTCLDLNPAINNPERLKIFIDDKLSNVTAALADGLFDIAIFYQDTNNLRTILTALTASRLTEPVLYLA